MRVAMYYNNNDVRLQEMPKPQIGPGELLVKVKACGICGSDVMEWYRIKKAPLVLGHEVTGEVAQVGEGVKNYKVDNRVFVSHHVPCNTCRYCLNGNHTACETLHTTNFYPGGFSEYIRVPSLNVDRGVFILPENISFEEGTFIEPLGCVIRAQRMVELKAGQSVLILGSGISGLLHLLLAKTLGAGRIIVTDINEYRLNFARSLGADAAIDAREDVVAKVREFNDNRLVDLAIVCAGALSAFNQALQSIDRAGTILCFAPTKPGEHVSIPVNDFWRNNIKIVHSYGSSPFDAAVAIELLSAARINVKDMITHKFDLTQTAMGFKLTAEAKESMKVIIQP